MTDTLRDKIAYVIVESRAVDNWGHPRPADYDLADVIIAALPGMVPDLVWDMENFHTGMDGGSDELCAPSPFGLFVIADHRPFMGASAGFSVFLMGERLLPDLPTIEAAKAAANAYRRAAWMATLIGGD